MSKLFLTQFLTRRQTWFSLLWRNYLRCDIWEINIIPTYILCAFITDEPRKLILLWYKSITLLCLHLQAFLATPLMKGNRLRSHLLKLRASLRTTESRTRETRFHCKKRVVHRFKPGCPTQYASCATLWKSLNPVWPRSPHRSVERRSKCDFKVSSGKKKKKKIHNFTLQKVACSIAEWLRIK